jgi:organic hydroperoxide reductase OsmC/OhrA
MDTKTASLYYWNGYDMFIGMFPNNAEHQHHVIQIEIGIEEEDLLILAETAKENCPVSKALAGTKIHLKANLKR